MRADTIMQLDRAASVLGSAIDAIADVDRLLSAPATTRSRAFPQTRDVKQARAALRLARTQTDVALCFVDAYRLRLRRERGR